MKTAQTGLFKHFCANTNIIIFSIFIFILVTTILASTTQAANNGLILHLNLNETIGLTATDSSGNSNNASITSGSLWNTSGKIGGAITLDGSNSFSTNKQEVTDFTISAWVKTTSTIRGDIALQFDGLSANFSGFGLVLNPAFPPSCKTGGVIGLWVGDFTDAYICTSSNIADGQWHLVTATWDNTTHIGKIFIDGSEKVSGSRPASSISSTINTMLFGKNPHSNEYFSGSLDDIRIYNRALTPSEIQKLHDVMPPNITILGSNPLVLTIGDPFADPGATAVDFEDNALKVSSTTAPSQIDTSVAGTYTIIYSVTDSSGTASTAERTVMVNPAPNPNIISDPPSDDDQDGPAGVNSNPSTDDEQDGPSGINSSPSTDDDQDGPAGVNSDPSTDDEQDGPIITETVQKQVSSSLSSNNSSSGSRTRSLNGLTTGNIGGGQVLGASTSCGIYLSSPLSYGGKNNPSDMEKLHAFLNEVLGIQLPLNGIFGIRTLEAVKQFQLAHKDTIIDPWIQNGKNPLGIATGFVGTTTLWTINNMVCPTLQLPKPVI
jgi:hypothetical protein